MIGQIRGQGGAAWVSTGLSEVPGQWAWRAKEAPPPTFPRLQIMLLEPGGAHLFTAYTGPGKQQLFGLLFFLRHLPSAGPLPSRVHYEFHQSS